MTDDAKPAYAMVQINMKNPDEFMERYAQHVFPILDAWGVEMIAGSMTPTTKEGDFSGNWAAVLRFPSMEVAERRYHSADYEPYLNLRLNELTDFTNLVFVEGR
ncbi:MAG: DUF1330 domain-containing protein [Acidimicrobiia bacterium]